MERLNIWVNTKTTLNKISEPNDLQCSSNVSQLGEVVRMEVKCCGREFSQKQTALLCLCFKEDVNRFQELFTCHIPLITKMR